MFTGGCKQCCSNFGALDWTFTGCIEGYVNPQGRYDFSGVRVVAVTIAASGVEIPVPIMYETYPDASGYFKLEGVELGTYDVLTELYGYLDNMYPNADVVPGEACTIQSNTTLLGFSFQQSHKRPGMNLIR